MSEHPIIFSAPMVRAILDGRKTMTRRVLKPQPFPVGGPFYQPHPVVSPREWHSVSKNGCIANIQKVRYAVGDRLWVREACRAEELSKPQFERPATAQERKLLHRTIVVDCHEGDGADGVRYLADNEWRKIENTSEASDRWIDLYHYRGRGKLGNIVPPIHMPRWASRITLAVTAVRVQRLQAISPADCEAEGAFRHIAEYSVDKVYRSERKAKAREYFREIWNKLHGPGSWETNPWVAAISFTVERNIDNG